jgi:GT2 family glycosyltransferase
MIFLLTVNYKSSHLIQKLIHSLPDHHEVSYKFLIINNSIEDVNLKKLENDFISIINCQENIGFGAACNLGIRSIFELNNQAIIWLINPDAYLSPLELEDIINFFNIYPSISILGTIIYTLEGTVWFSGGRFIPSHGTVSQLGIMNQKDQDYIPCDWVSGCSLILNLNNFSEPPSFDPAYFLYYEDLDFCQRYRMQGHQVAITRKFSVIHSPSSITNKNKFNKIKHSTFSYFLTLRKYSPRWIQFIFFLKLFIYALVLLPFHTKVAVGKLVGIRDYIRYTLRIHCRF